MVRRGSAAPVVVDRQPARHRARLQDQARRTAVNAVPGRWRALSPCHLPPPRPPANTFRYSIDAVSAILRKCCRKFAVPVRGLQQLAGQVESAQYELGWNMPQNRLHLLDVSGVAVNVNTSSLAVEPSSGMNDSSARYS
ncbi:hypothetical protein GCM10010428_63760 [Actinosynnema pretiosum subsp. pretiosum]